jgi:type I restriction enzyme S subunit
MKSNYSELGKYIKEVNERNSDLSITNLLGVSMEKTFIQSVANLNGVDMSVYKVLKNEQLACKLMSVGRDEKLPVDLYREQEPSIVSSAYYVFEPIDKEELLSEYLMMWLCRPENDRYIGFISGGDVRGGISWETFCSLPIKVPTISKQREIVKEYKVIQNRIVLNQQLIQKLEETAQALYKDWFVEFEFPDENGKPYKSNSGEMVWNEELQKEIPLGWEVKKLEELTKQICVAFVGSVYEYYCNEQVGIPMLRTTDITESGVSYKDLRYVTKEFHLKNKKSQLKKGDLLVARHGSNGMPVIFDADFEANALNVIIIKPNHDIIGPELIYYFLTSNYVREYVLGSVGGSVQEVLNTKKITELQIALPKEIIIVKRLSFILEKIGQSKLLYRKQLNVASELKDLLLSKLATIEN